MIYLLIAFQLLHVGFLVWVVGYVAKYCETLIHAVNEVLARVQNCHLQTINAEKVVRDLDVRFEEAKKQTEELLTVLTELDAVIRKHL